MIEDPPKIHRVTRVVGSKSCAHRHVRMDSAPMHHKPCFMQVFWVILCLNFELIMELFLIRESLILYFLSFLIMKITNLYDYNGDCNSIITIMLD
jgi:hypothetical protein